jgi:hypothetical protein
MNPSNTTSSSSKQSDEAQAGRFVPILTVVHTEIDEETGEATSVVEGVYGCRVGVRAVSSALTTGSPQAKDRIEHTFCVKCFTGGGRADVVLTGLSYEEAKAIVNNPEASSTTAIKPGPYRWFYGFDKESEGSE